MRRNQPRSLRKTSQESTKGIKRESQKPSEGSASSSCLSQVAHNPCQAAEVLWLCPQDDYMGNSCTYKGQDP